MNERRHFNRRERRAIYRCADGRCERCGVDLHYKNFHADHRVPFSRGGETSIENGQALCADCNLKKGNKMSIQEMMSAVKLRQWQKNFLKAVHDRMLAKRDVKNFLAVVATAAGKTMAAAYAGADMFARGEIDRVVVLVSSLSTIGEYENKLRKEEGSGWLRAFEKFGITIQHAPNAALETGLPPDVQGFIAHYASGANGVKDICKLIRQKRTLLILDESHHVSAADDRDEDDDVFATTIFDDARFDTEAAEWGATVQQMLDACKFSLLLTATPIRTDKERVPGIEYERVGKLNMVVWHFKYTYQEAYDDGVVREVLFHWQDAQARWLENGDVQSAQFSDEGVSAKGRTGQMSAFLEASSDSMSEMVGKALDKLQERRQYEEEIGVTWRSGMMVVAKDVKHAKKLAELCAKKGTTPVTVYSEDKNARDAIKAFGKDGCTAPLLVSIGMVAEGTDIPRLRVLVFATNKLTRLHFIQVVGRVCRFISGIGKDLPSQVAHVFMPAHARLIDYSMEFRDLHLGMTDKKDGGDIVGPGEGVITLGSTPTVDGLVIASTAENLSPEAKQFLRDWKLRMGVPNLDDKDALKIMRNSGDWPDSFASRPSAAMKSDRYSEMQHGQLRTEAQSLTRKAARVLVPEEYERDQQRAIGITRARFNKESLIDSVDLASREQLAHLCRSLEAAFRAASNPFGPVEEAA